MSKRYETLQIPSMCYLGLPCKNSSGDYSPKARLPPLPFMEKPHTHAFRSEIESRPRACRNATKLLGHSQCVIWEVHAKIHREIIPLRRVCLRSRSWRNRTRTRSGRKLKVDRGLVETLRNSLDTLNVLFGKCMQKSIGRLFP